MIEYKFLRIDLKYKIKYSTNTKVNGISCGEYLITVNMDERYEITLFSMDNFDYTMERMAIILNCYCKTDKIEVLINHLNCRFKLALLRDETI